jgi:hypothetical protein
MKSLWFPHDYSLETTFPQRELVWKRGFESVYDVIHDGKPSLLYDGRQVLAFAAVCSIPDDVDSISEEQLQHYMAQTVAEMGDKFVELIIFDRMEERAAYLAEKYPQDVFSKWTMQKYIEQPPD